MLRSIRQLYGKTLRTSDADIGHVKDFYFNDQQRVVRYVIADTGTWLLGRLVLQSENRGINYDPKLSANAALSMAPTNAYFRGESAGSLTLAHPDWKSSTNLARSSGHRELPRSRGDQPQLSLPAQTSLPCRFSS